MTTNNLICNGPITKHHLEEILQKYFKTDAKLTEAEGVILSANLGVTSDIIRVTLEWSLKDNGLPVTVIAKAPKIENLDKLNESMGGNVMEESASFVNVIHKNEVKAYEMLKDNVPIPIPKVYGSSLIGNNHPGLIVMEDLGDRAMIIDNIATGLNLHQWRSIVEHIADLNAWSLTTETPWRERIPDVNSMAEIAVRFFSNMAASGAIKMCKEKYPEYLGHVDEEKVLQLFHFDALLAKHLLFQKIMPDVVQQGDCWINNIMFEKNPDGTISDKVAAFIDWQLCMRGSGLSDLGTIGSFCLNHELRRANEMAMLRVYYDRFKSKAGDKLTASFDQIKYLYQESLSLRSLSLTFLADFMVQIVGKVDEDSTGWRSHELLSRTKAAYDDAAMYYGWITEIEK